MPAISVEEGKVASAKRALAEMTEAEEAAQEDADTVLADHLLASHAALPFAWHSEAIMTQIGVDVAMARLKEATQAKVEAKTKLENQTKAMAEVKQYVEEQQRQEDEYGKLFDELDKNGNGVVSHAELKKFIVEEDYTLRLQLGIGRWQEFLDQVDLDGDRQVSRHEFVAYFTRKNLDPEECWGAMFHAIDTNRDGQITQIELRNYSWNENPHILRLLGFKNWQELVDSVDKDGNKVIDRDEWLAYFTTKEIKGPYSPSKVPCSPAKRQRTA